MPLRLSYLVLAIAAGVNLYALGAFALAFRKGARPEALRRDQQRCYRGVVIILAAHLIFLALFVVLDLASGDPAVKATRLARAFSEGLNWFVSVLVTTWLPFGAAQWLAKRARVLEGGR